MLLLLSLMGEKKKKFKNIDIIYYQTVAYQIKPYKIAFKVRCQTTLWL